MQRMRLHIELSDGATFESTISNRAMVDYDFERVAKKWPPATEAPMVWLTFLAYRQLTHDGILPVDCTFKSFREDLCEYVEKHSDDDADPTRPEAASDSV